MEEGSEDLPNSLPPGAERGLLVVKSICDCAAFSAQVCSDVKIAQYNFPQERDEVVNARQYC